MLELLKCRIYAKNYIGILFQIIIKGIVINTRRINIIISIIFSLYIIFSQHIRR